MTHDSFPDFPYRSKLYFWSPVYLESSIPPFPARDSSRSSGWADTQDFGQQDISGNHTIVVHWHSGRLTWTGELFMKQMNEPSNHGVVYWGYHGEISYLVCAEQYESMIIWWFENECERHRSDEMGSSHLLLKSLQTSSRPLFKWIHHGFLEIKTSRSQHATVDPFL